MARIYPKLSQLRMSLFPLCVCGYIEPYYSVMGATGVGKTTACLSYSTFQDKKLTQIFQFVNFVSKSNLEVGNDLDSCTTEISRSNTFELLGHTFQLIDTPGFDDSLVSDTEILR